MIIFLGVVIELATIVGSSAIILKAVVDSLLEISEKGYNIDGVKLDEILKEIQKEENKKQKESLFDRVGLILYLIPSVNLLKASIDSTRIKETVRNNPQIQKIVVPKTEEEKEQYAQIEGQLQKLAFGTFTLEKEELMPLNYTFDEVKRLNEVTTHSYRVGKISGKNVAIIGIPNPESPVSRIQFKAEEYKIAHPYEKMTEEEAKDKTFTVYLFSKSADDQSAVDKIVQEIKQARIDDGIQTNLKTLEVKPEVQVIFERESPSTEKITSDTQKGPRLTKRMSSQRDENQN